MDEQRESYWLECAMVATACRRGLADPSNMAYVCLDEPARNGLIDRIRTLESALWTAYLEAKYRDVRAALEQAEREQA